jgi:plastocyanin
MSDRGKPSLRAQRALAKQRQKRLRVIVPIAALAVVGVIVVVVVSMGGGTDKFTLRVDLDDYTIEGNLVVPAGPVQLSAVNVGVVPHNVGLKGGPISTDLNPTASTELDLGELTPGSYQLYCDISDHEERGMTATLVVTEPA